MIERTREPQNLEMPFGALAGWKVPTERFYVRSHFPVPAIDPATFRITVEGHVENPLELTLDDVKRLPATTATLTLECAGNGRAFLSPSAHGLQWEHGAVGNADWTGVRLAQLLERARVKPEATEVVLVGADEGPIADRETPEPIAFDRSLPLAKATRPEVIVAYGMNGADLTPAHGFPLRAVVGGWYGMASVKWLTRVVVVDRPHTGYFQTSDYSIWDRRDGDAVLVPLTAAQPKAAIARPMANEVVDAGTPYVISGAAWAGESAVGKVDVSMDGGETWVAANLTGDAKPFCWVLWEYEWIAPETLGPVRLLARCTDATGATQPAERDPDRRTYMINHLIPVEVMVRRRPVRIREAAGTPSR